MAEIQDETFDAASEGLEAPDDATLAQDLADRQAAESQSDTAEEGDFLTEKFAYKDADGNEVELTGQDLLDAQERAVALEAEVEALKAKPPAEEKPAEAKPAEEVGGFEAVQWDVVGDNFQAMLEGEQGGAAAIGPALHDVVLRTIATDPIIADVVGRYIDFRVEQRERGVKAETSFKDFVGAEFPETEVQAFQKENPWARTKEMAVLGLKTARANKEIADLKAGKPAVEKAAAAKAAKETIASLKAKGTLRRVTTSGERAAPTTRGKPLTENQLLHKQVAKIQAMREGRQ